MPKETPCAGQADSCCGLSAPSAPFPGTQQQRPDPLCNRSSYWGRKQQQHPAPSSITLPLLSFISLRHPAPRRAPEKMLCAGGQARHGTAPVTLAGSPALPFPGNRTAPQGEPV